MKLATYQISKINRTLILFMSILLTTACGKFNSDGEQSTSDADKISDNVIDASKATLVQQKVAHKVAGVVYQTNSVATASVFNATGGFNYPSAATEFSGNISVSLDVADEQGIKQVLIGFVGSDMTLPICEIDCGTEFSAFVNGINPKLFALSSGEQTITLWVEDNDGNLSQVNNLNINWRELVITGVSATLNPDSEELSISWSPLTTALRYNVYVSNDVALTGQNYIDLTGGEAKLALTETSTVFTQKTVTADYYILVTGIDGSGESAFSDKLILINGNKSVVPIAAADTFSTDEDQILSNNLLLNDSAEGDIIVAVTTPVTLPTNGTVIITENGDFTYTPNENFNGTDQFSYSIINSHGLTSSNNVTITINAVNDLPSAINDTFVIEADTLTITSPGVLTNDTDIDNDPLTVITELLQQPKFGEVTINADGNFEYKKGVNFTTYDNFTYSITDGSDSSQSATVTITSPEFNGYPPVTINDSYETNEDAQLIVSEDKGILINDFDEDNATDELTLSVTTEPNNGALVIADDGSFTYQPNPNYFGNDQFSYSLTDDNNNSATAIVTINVIAQNDAPKPLNDSYIVQANSPNDLPPFFGILANDKDVDNDEISVVLDSISEPTSGSLVVLEDGSFSYTPNSEFIGTDSFTYKITDGKLNSVDATVQLFVSEVIATTDDLSPITISISELTNGFDTLYEINDINAEHGEITIDGDTITYTPTKGFGGFDTITIVYLIDGEEYTVSFYLEVKLIITPLADLTWDDPNIGECILNQYNYENANIYDVHHISCSGTFSTLTDLTKLPNLAYINFTSSTVNDWSALANLNIFEFSLHDSTNFTDFNLLKEQQNLTSMTFYNVEFTQWDFLSEFDLDYLNLDRSNFTDLTLLTHMTKLKSLLLANTSINDWSKLSLFNLYQVSVSHTDFSDLSLISHMSELVGLSADNIDLSNNDWSQINSFTKLNYLYASGSNLTILPSLDNMLNLNSLVLDNTEVTDFSPLTNLQLNYFSAHNTSFSDLNDLLGSQNDIHQLNINFTNVTDFTNLTVAFHNLAYLQANIPNSTPSLNEALLELYNSGVVIFNAPDDNSNGIFDFIEDIDGDGKLNDVDTDDDGDGVPDTSDAYPYEADASTLIDLANATEYSDSIVTSAFTTGVSRWVIQNVEFTTGGSALQSGVVNGNNRSILTSNIDAGDDGAIFNFDWKITSDNGHGTLALFIDGNWSGSINGHSNWTTYTLELPPGVHTIEWGFQNWLGDSNSAFIDNINVDRFVINDSPLITSVAPTTATEDVLYVYQPTVLDDDSNNGSDLIWSIENEPDGMLISVTGEVTWTPLEGVVTSGIVTITVEDGGEDGSEPFSEQFTITVTTVNDPPTFTNSNNIVLDENSKAGAIVFTAVVEDPDIGQSHTFSLSDPNGAFAINSENGEVFIVDNSLLNYEANSTFYFDITVTDENGLTDTQSVTLTLNDVLENTEFVLDASFANNGISNLNTYADTEFDDYLVDAKLGANNKRFVLSYTADSRAIDYVYTISKLNQDGTFDLSFANNGRKHLNFESLNDPNVEYFADFEELYQFKPTKLVIDDVSGENFIYVLGYQSTDEEINTPFLLRLKPDGTLDDSFDEELEQYVYGDGKYVHPLSNSNDDSEAVDLLITNNNGDITLYLAISSSSIDNSVTKSAKIEKFELGNNNSLDETDPITSYTYNFTSITTDDEYIIGLVQNSGENLIALGYVEGANDTQLMAAEVDIADLTSVLSSFVDDLGETAEETVINTYTKINDDKVILGGYAATTTDGEQNPFIAKLDITTQALESNVYYIYNINSSTDEEVISLDVDSSGNITYVTRNSLGNDSHQLALNQIDGDGNITATGTAFSNKGLTDTGDDGFNNGGDNDLIHAVVLFDDNDLTNTINLFSSVEKENLNASAALLNNELEIYYQQLDPENIPAQIGNIDDRINYEFQPTESEFIFSSVLHSSGAIITSTARPNSTYGITGQTITSHDVSTGLLNQTFGDSSTPSYIHTNADSTNYIMTVSSATVEISDLDVSGFNYLITAEVIDDDNNGTYLHFNKLDVNGNLIAAYAAYTVPDGTDIEGIAYNASVNTVALFGRSGTEMSNSLIITFDLNDSDPTTNLAINELSVSGLSSGYNRLNSGVIQDDGSLIALGTGQLESVQGETTFLIRIKTDGLIDETFDDLAADTNNDEVLDIATVEDSYVTAGKLVQLEDSSLIYFANDYYNNESFVVKLVDSNAETGKIEQKYMLDVNFGDNADGIVVLDMSLLVNDEQEEAEIYTNDLLVDNNAIILVGGVYINGNRAGFIAKFNSADGSPDATLGSKSQPGYFVPNGAESCEYLNDYYIGDEQNEFSTGTISQCDVTDYDRLLIDDAGSLIIHSTVTSSPENSVNSVILKYTEQQNDNADPYYIFDSSQNNQQLPPP
ncbi:MAG: hypothetical protein ACJAZB_001344 [Psychrosphaera sp.]|jgi:hypothetical protein